MLAFSYCRLLYCSSISDFQIGWSPTTHATSSATLFWAVSDSAAIAQRVDVINLDSFTRIMN